MHKFDTKIYLQFAGRWAVSPIKVKNVFVDVGISPISFTGVASPGNERKKSSPQFNCFCHIAGCCEFHGHKLFAFQFFAFKTKKVKSKN